MPDEVEPLSVRNTVHGDVLGDNVQIGYIGGDFTFHQHTTQRPPAELPLRIGVVPQPPASFRFRPVSLGDHTTVFSGMGGVGKTQLVADLVEKVWAKGLVKLVVWVTASSREAIVSTYAEAASELTGRDDFGPERGARRLLEWLARVDEPWCVVLDDLQDPADLAGLWPPHAPKGKILVTTRRRDAALQGDGRLIFPVDTFTENQALAYLQAVLGGQPALLNGAADVVRALGCLPLALAQAGAYMLDKHLSCAEYHARLGKLRPRKASPDEDEHQATVAATWSLSMEQVETLRPRKVAGLLLEIASVVDPNGVPLDVLVGPSVQNHLVAFAGYRLDEAGVRGVLADLHRLSLITLDSGEVRVHALVQRANRDTWNAKRMKKVVRAAGDALLEAWPAHERNDERGQVMRANALALMAVGRTYLQGRNVHLLPLKLGSSLGLCGLVAEARDHFERGYQVCVQELGPYDYFTFNELSSVAHWRGRAGDLAGAVAAYDQLIAESPRARRSDRPEVADLVRDARTSIAKLRAQAGDLAGALPELERLLAEQEAMFGPDHPDTISLRNDVLMYRVEFTGGTSPAEFERLIADATRVYGPDHPQTLAARQNLACWRGENGDVAGAQADLLGVLADSTRSLGAEHPKTLSVRSVLIDCVGHLGDPARAVREFEQLLAERLRLLGRDHPDVQHTWSRIAYWQQKAGN